MLCNGCKVLGTPLLNGLLYGWSLESHFSVALEALAYDGKNFPARS